MTVSAAPALAGPFDGNDAATSFSFDFKIFADSDLRVVLRDALTAEYLLTLDVDYSVSMNPDQNADPGGTITYPLSGPPLATGERLTVTTDLELSQQTVFTNLGKFFPATVEDTFDRLTMLLRQIQAESVRAIRVPVSLSDVLTDLPTPVPGAGLVWNEDGTAIVNGIPTESLIAISSFMANVIQAVDAAEARSDIGAAADAEVVKLTGDQTKAGVLTFSSSPVIPNGAGAQNPVSKAQLDAEAAARTAAISAAISAAVLPATLGPTLFVEAGVRASTSGTSVSFTGIPTWAKRVTMLLKAVSTNGTSRFLVQIGDTGSGSYLSSGYSCLTSGIIPASAQGTQTYTDGASLYSASAAGGVWDARVTFSRLSISNGTWVFDGLAGLSSNSGLYQIVGGVTVVGVLDKIRLTTAGGDTFDAGQVNVTWE